VTANAADTATGTRAVPVSFVPKRVVLDTNVLLDLFVFADARRQPMLTALEAGRWLALTNDRCLAEFRRVIARPGFALDAAARESILARYGRLAQVVASPPPAAPVSLPRCQDAEDQKFLELARDGRAEWLITSDKALLRLARKQRLQGLFAIVTPEQAVAP
jgi:putative PIN family toxin of toxin-antitoxin system